MPKICGATISGWGWTLTHQQISHEPLLMVPVLVRACARAATAAMIRSQSGASGWTSWLISSLWTVRTERPRLFRLIRSNLFLNGERNLFPSMMPRRAGISLDIHPAIERRRYIVTTSLIDCQGRMSRLISGRAPLLLESWSSTDAHAASQSHKYRMGSIGGYCTLKDSCVPVRTVASEAGTTGLDK